MTTTDDDLTAALLEDAERDRKTVAEWDTTLPDLPDERVALAFDALTRHIERMNSPRNTRRHWAPTDDSECVPRAAVLTAIEVARRSALSGGSVDEEEE